MKTIASVLRSDKIAYQLHPNWDNLWDKRGNAPLKLSFAEYETYNDGLCQHSPAFCVQWAELLDACLSLTKAILAEPADPAWRELTRAVYHVSDEQIRFCLTLKYREDKRQWFSLPQLKVSSSETKRNDRRWEELPTWANADAATACAILLKDTHYDWLDRAFIALRCRAIQAESGYWQPQEAIFKPFGELRGCEDGTHRSEGLATFQALDALESALKVVWFLNAANRQMDCAIQNSTRATEAKEQPKAEVAA